MISHNSLCSASAACATCTLPTTLVPSSISGGDYYSLSRPPVDTQTPPTRSQRASLLAIPAGLVKSMARGRGSKATQGRVVKEGIIISKLFNEVGSRPQPRNGIRLDQQITAEMTITVALPATSLSLPTFSGNSFALSSFGAAASYTALFDQYRFDQIEVWIEPSVAMGTTRFAEFYSAVDLDDANTPTTTLQVADRQGSITSLGGAGHYHKFKPHMAVAVYSGAFTSFSNESAGWIDSGSPNVQHYGIKTAAEVNTVSINYAMIIRAVVSFRAPGLA